jgi:hypothetical protein
MKEAAPIYAQSNDQEGPMCQSQICDLNGGIALNQITLSGMPAEEQAFWNDFLPEAYGHIFEQRQMGASRPLTPTDSIREKYFRALKDFDGAKYCQMMQIKEIFGFNE